MEPMIEEDRGHVWLKTSLAAYAVYLGEKNGLARRNAEAIIATLDAWLRPWTPADTVPDHPHEVEILLAGSRVVRGCYYSDLDQWRVDVGDDYTRINAEQVAGWREYDRPIVRAGEVADFMDGATFATASTGASEE